jgi:hypothetical protein
VKVPYGYGTAYRELADLEDWLLEHHHPEYVRRLVCWLESKDGVIGVGGGWRDDGSQPDKPGFAPEGKSFHQNQRFADGFIGAAAVDVVAARPGQIHGTVAWSQVPAQGSAAATRFGVHANVSDESWHIQPVEIDGWNTWCDNGCPAPAANYPLPDQPPPEEADDVTQDDINRIAQAVYDKMMPRIPGAIWTYMLGDIVLNEMNEAGDIMRSGAYQAHKANPANQ